jgi:hypothetical protein
MGRSAPNGTICRLSREPRRGSATLRASRTAVSSGRSNVSARHCAGREANGRPNDVIDSKRTHIGKIGSGHA